VIASEFSDVVVLRKSMPRSEYLNLLLNTADIGFVSTNKSVNSPSFPSKSLDYMMCGLPMIAAVEEVTDFGSIVEANKLGLACKANDIDSMSLAILKLVDDHLLRQEMSVSAKKFFKNHHYIDRVIEHFYNRGV
jgi:glycosyltransferase involved in cell wall biosynthesis